MTVFETEKKERMEVGLLQVKTIWLKSAITNMGMYLLLGHLSGNPHKISLSSL